MHRTAGLWLPLCSTPLFLSHSSLHFFSTSSSFSISGVFFLFIISRMGCVMLTIYLSLLLSQSDSAPSISLCLYHLFSSFNSLDLTHSIFPLSSFFSFLSLSLCSSDTLAFFNLPFPLKLEKVGMGQD